MSRTAAYTPEQQDAIERRSGPFALAANAGSGKTSVLVERYVRAVADDGVAPGRILAITFTDRAAGELRERVRAALADAGLREAARESVGGFVSTFHGFCARMLRAHAVLAGLAPGFTVLGDAQSAALREAAFDAAVAGWLDERDALDLAAAVGVAELREAIGSVYDTLRSRGQRTPALGSPHARHDPAAAAAALVRARTEVASELVGLAGSASVDRAHDRLAQCAELLAIGGIPAPLQVASVALRNGSAALSSAACLRYEVARVAYEEACADHLGVPAARALDGLLTAFGARYETAKRRRGVVDFDDLELIAGTLLAEHADVRAQWSARFDLLMVDELQDTNERQMAVLAALDRDNLFTVGDEFQSIYGFRHAEVRLFRDRRTRLAAAGEAGVLSANFRSRAPLLAAVNAVFASRFGSGFVPLVAGRSDAAEIAAAPVIELLVTDTDGWEGHEERLGVELAPAPLWRRAEARLLAARLDRLIRDGEARPEDVVVLFRAGGTIGVYESALADLGHATLATAGGGFFERPEIVDLVAYVRALANPLDELALYGVLASPLCGASSDVLVQLALAARENAIAVWDALLAAPPDERCAVFVERFRRARRSAAGRGLAEIVAAAVAEHGYDLHLCSLHAPARRIANVRKLERLAREFEQREGRDLRRFADALAAGRLGSVRENEAPPPADGTGAIRLMTIHSAKGLEFPVVCVADLGRQAAERQQPPLLLVDSGRVGLRLPSPERSWIEMLDYSRLRADRLTAAAQEEQRVIYVAMTRARERLILSGAARFAKWPAAHTTTMAWLGPAMLEDIQSRAAHGGGVAGVVASGGVPLRLTLSTSDLAGELLGLSAAIGDAPAAHLEPIANVAPPVAVPAAPAATLSYTAIGEYERCAYRYHLQRVLGLPDVVAPGAGRGEGAAARGIVVHALLERFDFAMPAVPDASAVAAAAAAAAVTIAVGSDSAAIAALVGAFASSPLCARLAASREVRREESFAFALAGGELLRGFLDVAALEADGTLLIVDYKTDRIADGADLAAIVDRDYALQRLVYALAGIHAGATAVEVAHCFLRSPAQLVSSRSVAADRGALEGELAQRLAPLRAGHFEVSADPDAQRCGTCPGRARLCSHDEALTLREPAPGASAGER
jgi:ATP-dependent helicase/nuclease subunit A